MTHDEKAMEAAIEAVGAVEDHGTPLETVLPRDLTTRIARAAITAYQAEAWQKDATFEIQQDGMTVALASGPRDRAYAEAMHYAAVYGQDGPVEVFEHVPVPLPTPPASP